MFKLIILGLNWIERTELMLEKILLSVFFTWAYGALENSDRVTILLSIELNVNWSFNLVRNRGSIPFIRHNIDQTTLESSRRIEKKLLRSEKWFLLKKEKKKKSSVHVWSRTDLYYFPIGLVFSIERNIRGSRKFSRKTDEKKYKKEKSLLSRRWLPLGSLACVWSRTD